MMFRMPIEAVLFDMDGLLLDTETIYTRALLEAAESNGLEMPLEFCHWMIGMPGKECEALIQDFFGPGLSLDRFRESFKDSVARELEAGLTVKTGAVEILDFLEGQGLPTAVVTSTGRTTADRHLQQAGLLGRFKTIVTGDDVNHGKPAPDIYLEAARRLGVAPERCIALEDSHNGLRAAHAAGTMAIMVPDIVQPSEEARGQCVAIARDLHAALALLQPALSANEPPNV
jgi:HAD superfamily hydrolase (TIGR01509 family)